MVIGEGIKKEWLSKPMSVKGMHILGNALDWQWDGNSLNVRLHGAKLKVRAGTPFEKNTDLKLKYY